MAIVEAASAHPITTEGRIVVLSDSLVPRRRITESDDLLIEAIRSAAIAVEHVAIGRAPVKLSHGDVCFDTLGVGLSDAYAVRLALMAEQKRETRFAWIKVLRGQRLPQRFAALPEQRRTAFRRALEAVDHLIVAGDAIHDWLRAEFSARCPVQCISGLLPFPPGYLHGAVPQGLARFLADHERNICCPGVFEPESGFDQVADAVDQLRTIERSNIGLVLIAVGPRKNRQFAQRVTAGRPWIHVAEGLQRLDMLRTVRLCDAMARCMLREDCGLLRVEAVRLGTPVVAARTCGETRGMRLFDFGSRYQLIIALRRALREGKHDPELRRWSSFFTRLAQSNAAELKSIALHYLALQRGHQNMGLDGLS